MGKLIIYKIRLDYVNYLRQFDTNICLPKEKNRVRPYVGIIAFTTSSYYYFAPLTSQTNKPDFYCVKLFDDQKNTIAGVRINNMIPIPKDMHVYDEFKYEALLNSSNPDDVRYGNLIKQELACLSVDEVRKNIVTKAKFFYNSYRFNPNIKKLSNNFKFLEQKALEYNLKQKQQEKTINFKDDDFEL